MGCTGEREFREKYIFLLLLSARTVFEFRVPSVHNFENCCGRERARAGRILIKTDAEISLFLSLSSPHVSRFPKCFSIKQITVRSHPIPYESSLLIAESHVRCIYIFVPIFLYPVTISLIIIALSSRIIVSVESEAMFYILLHFFTAARKEKRERESLSFVCQSYF